MQRGLDIASNAGGEGAVENANDRGGVANGQFSVLQMNGDDPIGV